MTDPIANPARLVLERALALLAEGGCACEPGGEVCRACAAIAAMEQLGEAEVVEGMRAEAGEADDARSRGAADRE